MDALGELAGASVYYSYCTEVTGFEDLYGLCSVYVTSGEKYYDSVDDSSAGLVGGDLGGVDGVDVVDSL